MIASKGPGDIKQTYLNETAQIDSDEVIQTRSDGIAQKGSL